MTRLRAAALALTLAASSLVAVAAAAPATAARAPMAKVVVVEGKACSTVGAKSSVRSTQYVCTKSGSKAVWRVNVATVKAGRGCTKVAELAEVGSTKALFSCVRNAKKALVWKAASKECKSAVGLYAESRKNFDSIMAQIAAVEASAKVLPAAEAATALTQLASIKASVTTIGEFSKDLKASIPLACGGIS
jgi:hypothetical protein